MRSTVTFKIGEENSRSTLHLALYRPWRGYREIG